MKKSVKPPKNLENILFFHIWKAGGFKERAVMKVAAHWIFGTQSKLSLALLDPIPAFIAVLPVLFRFYDFSVMPPEESHLQNTHT